MTNLVAVWLQMGGTVPVALVASGMVFTTGVAVFSWRRLLQMEDRVPAQSTLPATHSRTAESR